ncbi:hypothetical protein EAF04_004021 [Stromatinia cepivora]|nr:hypothetical protein EAF04_004021 [Stromatinia cepivora]
MPSCKAHQARKRLYRAGDTLQEIFYRYRQTMFDKKIVKVESKNGKLYIHEGDYPDMTSNLDILHDFPDKLVQNKEDKQAILTYLAASDAVAEVQRVGPAGERDDVEYSNIVFKVTLQNGGGVYILDLAGAQYGYYAPVTPWSQYIDNRVSKIKTCYLFGTAQTQRSWINEVPSLLAFTLQMNQGCSRAMKTGMEEWESNSMGVLKFLGFPQEQFEKQRRKLFFVIEVVLIGFREHINEQARKGLENPGAYSTAVFTPGQFEGNMKDMAKFCM